MGINPLGSNKKARTTLIFNREVERIEFKNAIADIAATRNSSPSEMALTLVLEYTASTDKARSIARTMYAAECPRCLDGFEIIFQELAALGERGRDSEPILRSFLELSLELGLNIDTTCQDNILLSDQWDSVTNVLEDTQESGWPRAALAAHSARRHGSTLKTPCAFLSISPLISFIAESWELLRGQSCTYRVLCCLARMAFPTRKGMEETAETRLAFLRAADRFYTSGEEGEL